MYDAWLVGEKGFERRVAIKRVLPELLDDTAVRRMFLDEARIVSRLHHGNIVQVIDYGTIDGTEFLAMEYVDGMDARKAVRVASSLGTPMPVGVAAYVVAQVAHALDYAHELRDDRGVQLGIVHRDVTPQNVLLSWTGDVKLSDFGIALAEGRDERTATGIVKGKVGFIAPEQLAGGDVTGAADVFALGATLHALLTGQSPWSDALPGRGADLRVDTELPGPVASLVHACMALEPANRPTARHVSEKASAIAASGLAGDGRSALRDWLAPLARETTQPHHVLDDLMRLALVPVSPANPRTLRVQMLDASAPLPPTPVPAPPRPRRRALAGVAASAALLLAGGTWAYRERTAASPPPGAPAQATAVNEARGAAEPPPEESAPQPPPSAAAEPAAVAPSAAGRSGGRPRARPVARNRPPAAPAAGVGWLRVGGAQLLGARVSLDGKPVGLAPLEQVVPAGKHRLLVTEPSSGRPLVDTAIEIAPSHSRQQPLQVMR